MRWSDIGVAVAAVLLAPALAGAEGHYSHDGVEVTPFLALAVGGEVDHPTFGETEFEESGSYGLVVDVPIRPGFQLELLFSHQSTELQIGEGVFGSPGIVDFDVEYFHVGALWEWGPSHRTRPWRRARENSGPDDDQINERRLPIRPFVTVTGGLAEWNPQGVRNDSETMISVGVGGGVKFVLGRHVGIRLDGRLLGSFANGSGDLFCSPDGCLGDLPGSFLVQFHAAAGLLLKF